MTHDSKQSDTPPPQEEDRPTRFSLAVVDAETLAPIFFTVLFLGTTVALFYVLSSFVADAVVSFILIGLFQKPYRRMLRRCGQNRWLASGLVTLLICAVLLLPICGFFYALTIEASSAFESAAQLFSEGGQGLIDQTVALVEKNGFHITRESMQQYLENLTHGINQLVVSFGSNFFGNILDLTVHSAVVVVMIFYLFADGDRLRDFMFKLSPLPDEEDALLVDTFGRVARGVVVGNGLGSAIQGLLGGVAMWAVGLPSPLLWGTVMTVFAFLPLVGITIVVVPASVALLMQGKVSEAMGFFIFCIVMGMFVDNVVKTKLMGSAMRMHDLLVFLSIIGGLSAFGIIGFVYGPLIAMLFMTLHGLYDSHYMPHIAQSLAPRARQWASSLSDKDE